MSGSLRNTRRKPCSSASSWSGLPGSVMATNCRPLPPCPLEEVAEVRERLDRPAGLRGDEEERLREVERALERRARAPGSVESSTCSRRPRWSGPNDRRMTSGPSDEPPMPSSAQSVRPSRFTSSANAARSPHCSSIVSEIVSQPSRFADLGRAGLAPERVVLAPDAARHVLLGRLPDPLGDRGLELVRDVRVERRRAAGDGRLARALDARDQLLHRLDEQRRCPPSRSSSTTPLHVDAGVFQPLHRRLGLGLLDVGRRAGDLGLLAGGQQRRHRHRVDRVAARRARRRTSSPGTAGS